MGQRVQIQNLFFIRKDNCIGQQIRRESLLNNDETLERIEDEISSYFHNNIIKISLGKDREHVSGSLLQDQS